MAEDNERPRMANEDRQALAREQGMRREAEAARRRFAFLADATQVLNDTSDDKTMLDRVARLAIREIADVCVIDLLEDGRVCRVAVAHKDPAREQSIRNTRRRFPPELHGEHPSCQAIQSGRSLLFPDVDDSLLQDIAHDAEHLECLRALHMVSAMVVPFTLEGRILGTITYLSSTPERHYDVQDMELAEELARRSAIAIENVRLNRKVSKAEEHYRFVIESSPHVMWTADADGMIDYVNHRVTELTGFPTHELMGDGWKVITYPEEVEDTARRWNEAVRSGIPFHAESRLRMRDGDYRWFLIHAIPWRDKFGRVCRWVGTMTDNDGFRRAADALRESEERFRLLAENAQDTIYRYRLVPERGYDYISPSVVRMTGRRPEEYYADPFLALRVMHPADRHYMTDLLAGEEVPFGVQYRVVPQPGQIVWVELRNTVIRDAQGNPVVIEGIARDITEQKRLEKERTDERQLKCPTATIRRPGRCLTRNLTRWPGVLLVEGGPTVGTPVSIPRRSPRWP